MSIYLYIAFLCALWDCCFRNLWALWIVSLTQLKCRGAERLIRKIHWTINFLLQKFHQNCFTGLSVKYIAHSTFYSKNSIKSILSAYPCPLYCHRVTSYNLPFNIRNQIQYQYSFIVWLKENEAVVDLTFWLINENW